MKRFLSLLRSSHQPSNTAAPPQTDASKRRKKLSQMFSRRRSSGSITPPPPTSPLFIPVHSPTNPNATPGSAPRSSKLASSTGSPTSPQLPNLGRTVSSFSSPSRSISSAGPSSPHVVLLLEEPTIPVIWTICHQIAFFHDLFIDKVTATSVDPTCAKVLQKNLMFKMSEEALIVAAEFANLVHGFLSTLEFGQRHSAHWSLDNAPAFKKLRQYTRLGSVKLFGARLGRKIDYNEVYRPPHVPSSRYASKGRMQGISAEQNDLIVKGITYKIEDWNAAIVEFLEKFDPYRLLSAVQLMLETANKLRKAADGVIRLVERNYRIALGMRPIQGTSEAKMVYLAIVKEHGTNLQAEVKMGLDNVVSRALEDLSWLEPILERSKIREETELKLGGHRMPMERCISVDREEWYAE